MTNTQTDKFANDKRALADEIGPRAYTYLVLEGFPYATRPLFWWLRDATFNAEMRRVA